VETTFCNREFLQVVSDKTINDVSKFVGIIHSTIVFNMRPEIGTKTLDNHCQMYQNRYVTAFDNFESIKSTGVCPRNFFILWNNFLKSSNRRKLAHT